MGGKTKNNIFITYNKKMLYERKQNQIAWNEYEFITNLATGIVH